MVRPALTRQSPPFAFSSRLAAAKAEPLRIIPPEPDNTTDVEDCIRKASANDKELTRININNLREVKAEVLKELLNGLKENTHVEVLEMANVGMTDSVGRVGVRSDGEASDHLFSSSDPGGAARGELDLEDGQLRVEPADRPGDHRDRA